MAFGTLVTYDDPHRREDLTDLIVNISPIDTPLMSRIGSAIATNTFHEWGVDALAARADNAAIEGADPTFSALTVPTRTTNITQIFTKEAQVSGTEQAVNQAGIRDQLAYQIEKKLAEIKNDMELALIRGSVASGTGTAARRLDGLHNIISDNSTTVASGTQLSETLYNGLAQLIYDDGTLATETYVGAALKKKISGFTQGITKFLDADDKRFINEVNVHEGDFGTQRILLSRDVLSGTNADNGLIMVNMSLLKVAWLRRLHTNPIAETGDAVKTQLIAEATLEFGDEKAHAQMLGLSHL